MGSGHLVNQRMSKKLFFAQLSAFAFLQGSGAAESDRVKGEHTGYKVFKSIKLTVQIHLSSGRFTPCVKQEK